MEELNVSKVPRCSSVIDMVWATGKDGQWHTETEVARSVPFKVDAVIEALEFLVKYGFARFSNLRDGRFKLVANSPNPREAANLLRDLSAT